MLPVYTRRALGTRAKNGGGWGNGGGRKEEEDLVALHQGFGAHDLPRFSLTVSRLH